MNREEILNGLKEILRTIEGHDDKVIDAATEESNLKSDLGLNSIGMLYIMITIEEKFEISFADSHIEDFKTLGDVTGYIEENV